MPTPRPAPLPHAPPRPLPAQMAGKSNPGPDDYDPPVPLSYLVKANQMAQADIWFYLGRCFGLDTRIPAVQYGQRLWRVGTQYLAWIGDIWQPEVSEYLFSHQALRIDFLNVRPTGDSHVAEGPISRGDALDVHIPGHTVVLDNAGGTEPRAFEQDVTVTLEDQHSTTTAHTFHNDLEIGADITIGGSETGGSFKASLKDTLGWSDADTSFDQQSSTHSETIKISTTVPPGDTLTGEAFATELHSTRTVVPSGPWGCGIRLSIHKDALGDPGGPFTTLWHAWQTEASPPNADGQRSIVWPSWAQMLETLAGYDVSRPAFSRDATAILRQQVLPHLGDPSIRTISIPAVEHSVTQSAAVYRFRDQHGHGRAVHTIHESRWPDHADIDRALSSNQSPIIHHRPTQVR